MNRCNDVHRHYLHVVKYDPMIMLDNSYADKQDISMTQAYIKKIEYNLIEDRFKFIPKPAPVVRDFPQRPRKKNVATNKSSTEPKLKELLEDKIKEEHSKICSKQD